MKRTLTLFLALIIVLSLTACGSGTSNSSSSDSFDSNSSGEYESKNELSESLIDLMVQNALLDKIREKYSEADPLSTKYRIANTQKDYQASEANYTVYGTLTLYDKYGQITTGYLDGSGSYSKTFEVKIEDGEVKECEIDG